MWLLSTRLQQYKQDISLYSKALTTLLYSLHSECLKLNSDYELLLKAMWD
jgi:hypothetical protein